MRNLVRAIGVSALFAALVTGCSSGELLGSAPTPTWDAADKTAIAKRNNRPTRTPIPTSTPRVKATAKSVTINPTATTGPTGTPFPTPTPNPLNDDFAPVLLGVEELPTGWTSYPAALDLETTFRTEVCGVPLKDPTIADVAVDFEKSFDGPYVTQFLSLYNGAGNANAVLLEYERAYQQCPPEGWTDEDGSFLYLSPLAFPEIGDASFAFRVTYGLDDVVVEGDIVFFQIDEVISVITYLTYLDFGPETLNSATTEEFARKAEAKIRAKAGYIDSLEIPSQAI